MTDLGPQRVCQSHIVKTVSHINSVSSSEAIVEKNVFPGSRLFGNTNTRKDFQNSEGEAKAMTCASTVTDLFIVG